MKKLFSLLLIAATAQIAFGGAQMISAVSVDVLKVNNEFYKAKLASRDLESKIGELQVEATAMVQELKDLETLFVKQHEASNEEGISEEEKTSRQADQQTTYDQRVALSEKIQAFSQDTERKISQARSTYRNKFFKEIMEAATQVGQDEGANVVIDTSGVLDTGMPPFIYISPDMDITDAVIAAVNADAPADMENDSPLAN